jgi:hypothetical protein
MVGIIGKTPLERPPRARGERQRITERINAEVGQNSHEAN